MICTTLASSETIYWYQVASDRTITIRHEVNPYYPQYIVYKLLSDGENLYLRRSENGNTILLNNFDIQYKNLSNGVNFSDSTGIWYVSSEALDRAAKTYEEKIMNNSIMCQTIFG